MDPEDEPEKEEPAAPKEKPAAQISVSRMKELKSDEEARQILFFSHAGRNILSAVLPVHGPLAESTHLRIFVQFRMFILQIAFFIRRQSSAAPFFFHFVRILRDTSSDFAFRLRIELRAPALEFFRFDHDLPVNG